MAWWDLAVAGHDEHVRARTLLVADEDAIPSVLYQVPIVARDTASVTTAADHLIGSPEPGVTLVDGPHDPAYSGALLELMVHGRYARGSRAHATGRPARRLRDDVSRAAGVPDDTRAYDARVLLGEQSNTSLIYESADGALPVVCKVFRRLHPGLNPDIELQTALSESGSGRVPRAIGAVEGTWPDLAGGSGHVAGALAFAQEFLPGAPDGWRVALRAAADGDDFRDRAHALGLATAEVHRALAALFPTRPARPVDREAAADTWSRRLTAAIAEMPAVAAHREAIEAVYAGALRGDWPMMQRIHGDYHLGQVLDVPGRGWVLLDFEGEPLRPMNERMLPDLALRDMAGMLRSFDYVAGSLRLDRVSRSPEAVQEWARTARTAFLDGYASASGADLGAHGPLLTALELDKAVYETVYEARNRPAWATIPLQAISQLVERSARMG